MRLCRHIWGLLAFASMLYVASPTWAATPIVDTVGGTNSNPWTISGNLINKGNIFSVTKNTTLIEQEIYLDPSEDKTLTFYVYQSDTQHGAYSQLLSKPVNITAIGADWYSSGDINVPLQAGKYYMMGFSLPLSFRLYYNSGQQDVSFGRELASFSGVGNPLALTLTDPGQNTSIYYQRLTTLTPEPTALALLGLGLGGMVCRRRGARA